MLICSMYFLSTYSPEDTIGNFIPYILWLLTFTVSAPSLQHTYFISFGKDPTCQLSGFNDNSISNLICMVLSYFFHTLISVLFCFKKCPVTILTHFSLRLFILRGFDSWYSWILTIYQINGFQIFSLLL